MLQKQGNSAPNGPISHKDANKTRFSKNAPNFLAHNCTECSLSIRIYTYSNFGVLDFCK